VKPTLVGLHLGAPPAPWAELGFDITDAGTTVGTVSLTFDDPFDGIGAWSLAGVDESVTSLDGVPTRVVPPPAGVDRVRHPNGSISIDHVVLETPDLDRTVDALGAAGLELRRIRDAGRVQQAFYRIGEAILEVVGPHEPSGDEPGRLWGLVCTVRDLDATAACLGDRLLPVEDAVQPGRRIATVHDGAGLGVPLAFMTPDRR
jgi:catechol 2,3-dioxygenase-like lactoylglutathione lyase family enzyme